MEELTADEAEQYDRQIRLWGLDAQKRWKCNICLDLFGLCQKFFQHKLGFDPCDLLIPYRLRSSTVLVVGLRGLGSEVVKNIVLAGVNQVTILDHAPLSQEDVAGRFLMQREGRNVCTCFVWATITLLSILYNCIVLFVFFVSSTWSCDPPPQRAEQAVAQLQVLNPNVTVIADSAKVEDKQDEFFKRFNVICATCCATNTLVSHYWKCFHPAVIHVH